MLWTKPSTTLRIHYENGPNVNPRGLTPFIIRIVITFYLFSHLLAFAEEAKNKESKNTKFLPWVSCATRSIDGTVLQTEDLIQEDDEGFSRHQCKIGYIRRDKKGSRMSPVITLPSLANDRYRVKFSAGNVIVTAHKSSKKIVVLHLEGISPNMIINPQIKKGKDVVGLDAQIAIDGNTKDLKGTQSRSNDSNLLRNDFEIINGTTLYLCHDLPSTTKSEESMSESVIGYKRESTERSTFTPVLSLPHLTDDRYAVTFAEGSIHVKSKSGECEIVELNLENLAPSAISVIYEVNPSSQNQ